MLDPAAAHRISAALARSTSEQQKQQNRVQRMEQRQQKVKQKDEEEPRPDRKRLVPVLLATEAERLLVQSGQSGRAYRRSIRPLGTENKGKGEVDTKVDPVVEQPVQPSIGKYNRTVTDSMPEQSGQLKVVNGDLEPKPKPFAFRPYPTLGVAQKPTSNALPELSSRLSSTPISQHTLNLLAILDVAKGDPRVNSDALFNIMSYIDSAAKTDSTATITDILRRLVPTTTPPATSPQRPQTPPQTPVASNTPASPDDGIVLLDKENVNPTAFRRRAEHDTEDAKLLAAMGPSNSTPLVRLGAGLIQSVRSNTSLNNDPTPPTPSTPPTARKRTLSEMSDDGRSFGQGRVVRLDWSSPPRFHRTDQNTSPGFSKDQPIIIPDSPAAPRLGGPVRSRVKPYVVPDWARTETVMQPRLSEQAQEAIKEAERRKFEEKSTKRMKKMRDRTSSQMHRTISTPAVFSTSADKPIASISTIPSRSMAPPPPVAATSLLPIIAATDSLIPLPRSRLLSPSRSLSPTPTQHFVPPCTPPRKRIVSATSSPEEGFSLFTPREMNTPRRGPSLFESPSIRSPSLRSNHERDATPPPSSEPVAENDSDDGRSDGEDDLLDRELNNALEEADNSSPLAISPTDDADKHQAQVEDNDDEEEPSKQFWSGLPPSSPPAPSSPILFPVVDQIPTDNSDDFELPMASSDFDVIDYGENLANEGPTNRNRDGLSRDNEVVPVDEVQFDEDALTAILELITNNNPNVDSSTPLSPDTDTNDDSGDILRDLGAISYFDDQHSSPSDQITLSNFPFPSDISFDNPSFWNAMGPLLDQASSSGSNGAEGSDQIKNLLSGCVL